MPDTLSPDDLATARLLVAREAQRLAEIRALRAEMQIAEIALGQVHAGKAALNRKCGIGPHDNVDLDTGRIARAPVEAPPATEP